MDIEWFGSNTHLIEIATRGVVMYVYTVLLLRIFGKRTTLTTAGFDLVVTIAAGTLIGSTVLSTTRPLAQGMVALAALFGLQWCASYVSSRSQTVETILMAPSRALLREGKVDHHQLSSERMSIKQLHQNIRQQGHNPDSHLDLVTLESSGMVSVLASIDDGNHKLQSEA